MHTNQISEHFHESELSLRRLKSLYRLRLSISKNPALLFEPILNYSKALDGLRGLREAEMFPGLITGQ